MPFRLNTKNVFLTYPQCDITPRELGEHLASLRPTRYIQVVRERHQDGNNHLHVLLQWVDKFNLRNERFFDFARHHPNIQAVRSVSDVFDYICKALPTNPSDEDEWKQGEISINPKSDKWMKVVQAATEQEVLQAALEASPRDFVLQNDKILDFARKKARIHEYQHDESIRFNVPESLIAWMTTEFTNPVGLCPWMMRENHLFSDRKGHRIVLKHCCSRDPRAQGKRRGPEVWDAIFTGGDCLTSRHSTQKQLT